MTRGVGWLRCSGILLDAGPLVEDWDVQDVANRLGAAAAAWLCGHFDVVLPGSLASLHPLDSGSSGWGNMEATAKAQADNDCPRC